MTAIEHATTTGGTATATGQGHSRDDSITWRPKHVEAARPTRAADIWALVSSSTKWARIRPFEGDSRRQHYWAILKDTHLRLGRRHLWFHRRTNDIVSQCLVRIGNRGGNRRVILASALKWVTGSSGKRIRRGRHGERGRGRDSAAALAGISGFRHQRTSHRVCRATDSTCCRSRPKAVHFGRRPSPGAILQSQLAISPDGRRLAFVAVPGRRRPECGYDSRDSVIAHPLAGTEGAAASILSH